MTTIDLKPGEFGLVFSALVEYRRQHKELAARLRRLGLGFVPGHSLTDDDTDDRLKALLKRLADGSPSLLRYLDEPAEGTA
ncbi:MAG: hypothetical protein AB7U73_01095 [Pirellulales bacterium]